jgi:hypothetical protein
METLHGCHTPEVDIISLPSASDLGSDVDLNENDVGTGGSPIVTSENANYYFRDGSLRIQVGKKPIRFLLVDQLNAFAGRQ